jgi:hypothetical protein
MQNILVFPCGSEVALDIHSCVKYSTHFHFIGASSLDDHGKFEFEDYISGIPFINDPEFIPTLTRLVKEREIDAIYPALDSVILTLKEHENEIGCKIIAPCLQTVQICNSKLITYEVLQGIIPIPKVYTTKENVTNFPVFVKPCVGCGAKGTMKISSCAELENLNLTSDLLLLEYLPGAEYTVDCFTDKNGTLLYSAARSRRRIRNGISVNTIFEENQDEFKAFAEKINNVIAFQGAWFYQVKRDIDGRLCLLEIAARLGGSSLLSKAVGVNLPLLTLFDAFGYDVSICKNSYKVELDRALNAKYQSDLSFNSVYVDYDDCLILNKQFVNTELISFIYKCYNQGKQVYLLTKHDGNLEEELRKFKLDRLFDKVIHITPSEQKFKYIIAENPIFIDDSNAERQAIKKHLNIPVFAPDMIDVLNS